MKKSPSPWILHFNVVILSSQQEYLLGLPSLSLCPSTFLMGDKAVPPACLGLPPKKEGYLGTEQLNDKRPLEIVWLVSIRGIV